MSPEFVVIVGIDGQNPAQVGFAQDHDMIQALAADEPISLSACPFCHGDRGAVGRSRMPMAARRRVTAWPYEASLSRMKYLGACSHGKASVIWRATHSAVGLAVTLIHTRRRR